MTIATALQKANGFLSGFTGGKSYQTLVVYKLDPTGTVPIEPLLDLTVGSNVNRITIDLIESENYQQTYSVSQNTLSNSSLATSHVTRNLKGLSVTGFLVPNPSMGISGILNPANLIAPISQILTKGEQLDRKRITILQSLADQGLPVGVYTPRWGIPRAFITSIACPWDPEVSQNSRIVLEFLEARIVSPVTGIFVDDFTSQIPGNNQLTGGGQTSANATNTSSLSQPSSFGASPNTNGSFPT